MITAKKLRGLALATAAVGLFGTANSAMAYTPANDAEGRCVSDQYSREIQKIPSNWSLLAKWTAWKKAIKTCTGPTGIFPVDNPWNTDIFKAPIDPNSEKYIVKMTGDVNVDGYLRGYGCDVPNDGMPYVEVPGNQPLVPMVFTVYPAESDPGPYPIPLDAPIELDNGDGHVIAVDRTNGYLYELWQGIRGLPDGSIGWTASNGAKWNLNSNVGRPIGWTSADASGSPIFAGLVKYKNEVAKGVIRHALRFTVKNHVMGYVYPASHTDGRERSDSGWLPTGARLRLKESVDISSYGPQSRVVLEALKRYGMILTDTGGGSNFQFACAKESDWDYQDFWGIRNIKGTDFEVIQLGPLTMPWGEPSP